jgi:hypothetical protein
MITFFMKNSWTRKFLNVNRFNANRVEKFPCTLFHDCCLPRVVAGFYLPKLRENSLREEKKQENCSLNSSAMLNDSLVNYHAKRSSNIQREQLVRSLELCGDVEDPADGNQ